MVFCHGAKTNAILNVDGFQVRGKENLRSLKAVIKCLRREGTYNLSAQTHWPHPTVKEPGNKILPCAQKAEGQKYLVKSIDCLSLTLCAKSYSKYATGIISVKLHKNPVKEVFNITVVHSL